MLAVSAYSRCIVRACGRSTRYSTVPIMHKALTQMNLQIHHAISDITGLTGRAIVDAILAGQRDGTELAKLRDPHIKADTETI